MKLLSILLVGLALIANSSVSATPPVVTPNSATAVGDEVFQVAYYVVGHGPNPKRAEKNAYDQLWDAIATTQSVTGLTLSDLEITGEGAIGSTMYFIECVATFE